MFKVGDTMHDEEFIKLKNIFFKVLFFLILFMVPFTIIFITKFEVNDTNIIKKIKNEDKFLILVTKKNCSRCKEIKKVLKEKNIQYSELNVDKVTINDYQNVLRKINIQEYEVVIPAIITVENSKLKSSLVDIKDKNALLSYLENQYK